MYNLNIEEIINNLPVVDRDNFIALNVKFFLFPKPISNILLENFLIARDFGDWTGTLIYETFSLIKEDLPTLCRIGNNGGYWGFYKSHSYSNIIYQQLDLLKFYLKTITKNLFKIFKKQFLLYKVEKKIAYNKKIKLEIWYNIENEKKYAILQGLYHWYSLSKRIQQYIKYGDYISIAELLQDFVNCYNHNTYILAA